MELIKNYLSADELALVVAEMSDTAHNSVQREIIKVGIVAQMVIKDLGEFDTCDDIYNYVVENGVDFNESVFNYSVIDKLYKEENGIESVFKEFFDEINVKLDNGLSTLNNLGSVEEMVDKMKELTPNG